MDQPGWARQSTAASRGSPRSITWAITRSSWRSDSPEIATGSAGEYQQVKGKGYWGGVSV